MMETDNRKKLSNMLWFLGFAFLFGFYIFYIGIDIIKENFCGSTAIDYCAYWSTGKIINDVGISKIYDMEVLKEFQSPIYPRPFKNTDYFLIIPFPYLSIFALPFTILSRLSIKISYLVWVAINFTAFILYLNYFLRESLGEKIAGPLLVLLLFSVPFYWNIIYGQLNIWLGIFAGEFVRNLIKKRPIFAGVWLAGLLLKPQNLILVLPFLLFTKEFRVLIGFAVNSAILITGSFLLGGVEGALGWYKILMGSSAGRSAANPLVMMNWRMLSMHINNFTSSNFGQIALVFGVVITLVLLLRIIKNTEAVSTSQIIIRYLAIFTATMLITWHAHLSMGVVIFPFFAYAIQKKVFPMRLFKIWMVLPILFMFFIFFFPIVTDQLHIPAVQNNFYKLIAGSRGLILNMMLLIWAADYTNKNPNLELAAPVS